MFDTALNRLWAFAAGAVLLASANGCAWRNAWMYYNTPSVKMLGTDVDQYNEPQERNAEPAKYIVHQHEFELNHYEDGETGKNVGGYKLNEYGEDHVKRIAYDLRRGSPFQVIVERSETSVKPGTKYEFPVHYNAELDMTRRLVVVRALTKMGIPDADQRVVVAPDFTSPYTEKEAEWAYRRGMSMFRWGMGGMGGMGGGFGGFGGFGGAF